METNASSSTSTVTKYYFLLLILINIGRTSSALDSDVMEYNFSVVSDPDQGIVNATSINNMRSRVQCASECKQATNCDAFIWDSIASSCTIGAIYDKGLGLQQPTGSQRLYAQVQVQVVESSGVTCPTNLGYQVRSSPDGEVVRCLKISNSEVDYETASGVCSGDGGRLAKVDSFGVINVIMTMKTEINNPALLFAYIGLEDIELENTFVWSDGEVMTTDQRTTLFFPGLPDNMAGNEDCGEMWLYVDGRLNDNNCEADRYYICEVPL